MRHFISIIIIISFIWIGTFTLFNFLEFGISENEIVVIDDNDKLIRLIQKNTPVKIEISDDNWGRAVLEEPEVLFKIWNILSKLESYPDKYISNQDQISGYIYFIDGSKQFFAISDRFQLGEFLLGNINEEIDVKELYRILLYTLQTKKNLINMIEKADSIYLYKAGDFYDPDSAKMINVSEKSKKRFIDYVSNSNLVKDSNKLNNYLFEASYQPIFHILLSFDEKQDPVVLSVISNEFYNIMDMNLLNRNMIYFEGNLLDFYNEMIAVNSMTYESNRGDNK
ncbi:DUF3919 family protein [Halocella sp. SP3-1]|uniref:DUF3919 family protein n=1 Tax=Halocella sp. SP3-1 TaxID=2382161 RepID=UPI000F760B1A|nr:DUF3919 family protein [Halocella sp. SP3-1]AZO93411.1 DUF3919 family protein [Halocella sp. SP3-1]